MNSHSLEFSWYNFRWRILKDFIAIVIVFVLSIYVVYFTSQEIAKIFFLLLLLLFLLSDKDFFWFAYFFILAQGPGYFFADLSGASLYRLPLYTFLAGMSLTPVDIFVLLAFLKALAKGKRKRLQLQLPLLVLAGYIVFSVSVGFFIYGVDIDIAAWNLRWLFYYSIIISFLYLVHQKQQIYRFALLIFPFVFFIAFTQIYYISSGDELINLFDPDFRAITVNTVTGELRPITGGGLVVFFCYVLSFLLLADDDFKLPKVPLYLVLVSSFLSIFLSATRLWFVIFSFIFVGYTLVAKKKMLSAVSFVAIAFLVLSVLTYSGVITRDFLLGSSWGRLQQIFDVTRGDVSAVDNAINRLFNQMPIIVAAMKQNLLIGYGFSRVTMIYYDNDFGFLNTILMFGLAGLSLFVFFFVKLFTLLISSMKRVSYNIFL